MLTNNAHQMVFLTIGESIKELLPHMSGRDNPSDQNGESKNIPLSKLSRLIVKRGATTSAANAVSADPISSLPQNACSELLGHGIQSGLRVST